MTSASKVSDLFTASGEAFTKLAELAGILQNTLSNSSIDNDDTGDSYSNVNNSSPCWSVEETELLQRAVKRFGDDLNIISERIKDKTMCQIKSTFKKIQPALPTNVPGKSDDNVSNTPAYSSSPSKVVSSFQEANNLHTPVVSTELMTANRSTLSAGLSTESSLATKPNTKANPSTITSESSAGLSGQINSTGTSSAAGAASSICPSPSPFLHYPLLRKSADITLNMLNARDDSDDEDRMAGLSVFNST